MTAKSHREIPFNYTSADDDQIVRFLLGSEHGAVFRALRSRKAAQNEMRMLLRFLGDLFILRRNPFIHEEMVNAREWRRLFFKSMEKIMM